MKALYRLELSRMSKVAPMLAGVMVLASYLNWGTVLLVDSTVYPEDAYRQLSSLHNLFLLLMGVLPAIILLGRSGADLQSGVMSSYMSYPVAPWKYLAARYLAIYTILVPAAVLSIILLYPIMPYATAMDAVYVASLVLAFMLSSLSVAIAASLFLKHRPLPELIVLIYSCVIMFFGESMVRMDTRLYALNPMLFLRDWYLETGQLMEGAYPYQLPIESVAWGCASVVVYLALAIASLMIFNRMRWGDAERL